MEGEGRGGYVKRKLKTRGRVWGRGSEKDVVWCGGGSVERSDALTPVSGVDGGRGIHCLLGQHLGVPGCEPSMNAMSLSDW